MKFAIIRFFLSPIHIVGLLLYFIYLGIMSGFLHGQRIMSGLVNDHLEQQKRLR